MAEAVVAFFANPDIKEYTMGHKKSTLVSYLVQVLLAAAVVVFLYNAWNAKLDLTRYEYQIYAGMETAWTVRCVHDALFSAALIWLGFGGIMWVATTDFFDIFRYGFSSLLVLFTPFKSPKDHKKFYEYKQERAEKRKGKSVPVTILVIGVALFIGALATMFVHDSVMADVEAPPPPVIMEADDADEPDDMDEEDGADDAFIA